MSYVIRLLGLTTGRSPYDGMYLSRYDPDTASADPNGEPMLALVEATLDPTKALQFENAGAAMAEWQRTAAPPNEKRWDGKPNRPLTAFTVEITDLTLIP